MPRPSTTISISAVLLLALTSSAVAQPTRYEACTSGISAEGVIDHLTVYGIGPEPLGETEDLFIGVDGEVLALRAEVGGLWGVGETDINIPWESVDVGETWVRTPLLDDGVDDYTPLVDEGFVDRVAGSNSVETPVPPDVFRASELIGDFVRTRRDDSTFANFGVVDDLLIDKNKVAAVVVSPDVGLGLVNKYAITFDDYMEGGWTPASAALDLTFSQDEVEQIGAFDCD